MSCPSPLPVLLSISTAFSSEGDGIASQPSTPFIIKNTFIEVPSPGGLEMAALKQRSSSAPPSIRAASERGLFSMGSPCKSESAETVSSAASTTALDEDEDEVTSCSGSCTGSDTPPSLGWTGGTTILLADLLDEPKPRAKLNVMAAVYAPSCRVTRLGQALNLPPEVHLRLQEVMSVAQVVLLRENSVVQHVRVNENATGWIIVGSIHPAQTACAKRALATAGDQMLTAAKQSSNVHVVGAGANPFTPLHGGLGFSVKLAFVPNEVEACWNLLRKGFCARGCACKWYHPSWQATAKIQLEIMH